MFRPVLLAFLSMTRIIIHYVAFVEQWLWITEISRWPSFFLFIFCPAILSSSLCLIDFFPHVSGTQLNLTLYSQMLPFGKVGLVFLSVLACSHDI